MPSEETTSLPKLFSSFAAASSTVLSDIFLFCSSCFPRISSRATDSIINEPQRHANQAKWMTDLKDKRITFLSGIFGAFYEEIHTDIQLKPGKDHGPCKPAHRVLLATRSEIFKNMLDSSSDIKAPSNDTIIITIPELNSEELESLMEFLYTGSLPFEKLEKHVYSLFIAAEKYEIPYLQEFCHCYMLNSLNASTVLDVLETSEVCSNKGLKEIALNFIFKNTEDVVLSEQYEALATKNPQLCMQITREFFMNIRNEKVGGVRLGFQKKMGFQEKSCKDLQAKGGEGKMGNGEEFVE